MIIGVLLLSLFPFFCNGADSRNNSSFTIFNCTPFPIMMQLVANGYVLSPRSQRFEWIEYKTDAKTILCGSSKKFTVRGYHNVLNRFSTFSIYMQIKDMNKPISCYIDPGPLEGPGNDKKFVVDNYYTLPDLDGPYFEISRYVHE